MILFVYTVSSHTTPSVQISSMQITFMKYFAPLSSTFYRPVVFSQSLFLYLKRLFDIAPACVPHWWNRITKFFFQTGFFQLNGILSSRNFFFIYFKFLLFVGLFQLYYNLILFHVVECTVLAAGFQYIQSSMWNSVSLSN